MQLIIAGSRKIAIIIATIKIIAIICNLIVPKPASYSYIIGIINVNFHSSTKWRTRYCSKWTINLKVVSTTQEWFNDTMIRGTILLHPDVWTVCLIPFYTHSLFLNWHCKIVWYLVALKSLIRARFIFAFTHSFFINGVLRC